ncbi:hypothetical protein [Vineibacter terrae]|uniref:hypothetical protein n=1 Tax=Vineibacter terrae TaxID=2586908 RepID=UPI002E3779E2|nr:hypothetical protein [Vineibacter terrae]HEX2885888.1 hypothetical protein [Vineibacter terrae]
MSRLVNIYDADDHFLSRGSDEARAADLAVPVSGGVKGFTGALDKLVTEGRTFDRAVISTHGNEGLIAFNHEHITASTWRRLAGRGYDRIFPGYARIYFPGCNVAESEAGWAFLEEAAKVFLYRGGGDVFAHTTKGLAVGSWPMRAMAVLYNQVNPVRRVLGIAADVAVWAGLKGKIVHPPWTTVRGCLVMPGGIVWRRYEN